MTRRILLRSRGIALMMSLLLAIFVVSITVVLLGWTQHDSYFASKTALQERAYDLARGGLDYFRVHRELVAPSVTVTPPPGPDFFSLSIDAAGNITSIGTVVRGTTVYTRTLYVPQSNFPDIRDESVGDY